MFGLLTEDLQLAKNYEESFLWSNQFGCIRIYTLTLSYTIHIISVIFHDINMQHSHINVYKRTA